MREIDIQDYARKLLEAHGDKAIAEAAQKASAFEREGNVNGFQDPRKVLLAAPRPCWLKAFRSVWPFVEFIKLKLVAASSGVVTAQSFPRRSAAWLPSDDRCVVLVLRMQWKRGA